jgi:cytochrome d ubiquinol oxidase subunit II
MLDFSPFIDLPLVWGSIIALAILLYVVLDGFDLGVGIMFPFAPSDRCRDRMMNSIAPFWDANETWLVLGGGGLFAAFPHAYATLMPALYIPIIVMLLGLIFRGVAFEFRFKAQGKSRRLWDYVFHFGSLIATFMQGCALGAFMQGITIENNIFTGRPFDWLTPFSLTTGAALVFGYILLGATWIVMKTDEETSTWARHTASYALGFVGLFMVIVTIATPFLNEGLHQKWFLEPRVYYLLPFPILTLLLFIMIWRDLHRGRRDYRPFFMSIGIFLTSYLGLAIILWPWIVPFQMTIHQAAAAATSQSLLLIGTLTMLPIILSYTAYSYYVFRGKTHHETTY